MLSVGSRDAALCAPGNNTNIWAWDAYQTPNSASANGVDPRHGAAFCLFNNLWPTNYILWYPWEPRGADDVSRFRFDFSL